MDQMGSPYLLAHGLGVPVRDAGTTVRGAKPGLQRLWVRTRNWVAPWKVAGAPGKFDVLVDGKPVGKTFGTAEEAWHWEDGGLVRVGATASVALHDLTGFEGRCDALLFCEDVGFKPPDDGPALAAFRWTALGLPEKPEDGGTYDVVVVGGGLLRRRAESGAYPG